MRRQNSKHSNGCNASSLSWWINIERYFSEDMALKKFMQTNTVNLNNNPHQAGAMKLPWMGVGWGEVGGRGELYSPIYNSAPRRILRNGKNSESSSKIVWKIHKSFFRSGQYWGHQRPSNVKFSETPSFSEMCRYPRNYYRQQAAEKSIDGPWSALSLRCHQNWADFNG